MSAIVEAIQNIDFSSIEEMDPSLADGYHTVYDREVPLEIRNQQGNEEVKQGTLESIKVKMLLLGPDESPISVRLEFSSEADLFYHYMHIIDENGYRQVQIAQKLMVEFPDYPNVLIRMLNSCIREPHIHLGIFTMLGESDARLDFIQNMEYKFVDLMTCHCIRSPEDVVQQQITYRYNAIKQKLSIMGARLHEINTLVKAKNPSLLLQLQKATSNTNLNLSSSSFAHTLGNEKRR